jgi:hypothetical protein
MAVRSAALQMLVHGFDSESTYSAIFFLASFLFSNCPKPAHVWLSSPQATFGNHPSIEARATLYSLSVMPFLSFSVSIFTTSVLAAVTMYRAVMVCRPKALSQFVMPSSPSLRTQAGVTLLCRKRGPKTWMMESSVTSSKKDSRSQNWSEIWQVKQGPITGHCGCRYVYHLCSILSCHVMIDASF